VVLAAYFLSYMPVFYKIASIKSGNRNVNNFLPVSRNKGRSVTSIHYVQSICHNVVKQGLRRDTVDGLRGTIDTLAFVKHITVSDTKQKTLCLWLRVPSFRWMHKSVLLSSICSQSGQ
jgi:hypothetical protein